MPVLIVNLQLLGIFGGFVDEATLLTTMFDVHPRSLGRRWGPVRTRAVQSLG